MSSPQIYQHTARRVLIFVLPAFLIINAVYLVFILLFAKENPPIEHILFTGVTFLVTAASWWHYQSIYHQSDVISPSHHVDKRPVILVEQFLQLTSQLSIFVIIVDEKGIVQHVTDNYDTTETWVGQQLDTIAPDFKPLLDYERLGAGDFVSLVVSQANRTFNAVAYPIMDSTQHLSEVYIICQDLTHELDTYQALEASELQLQQVLAEYPDYLMIVRAADGVVLYSNTGSFLDYPVLGNNLLDIMSELQSSDDVDAFRLQWLIMTSNPAHTVEPITFTVEHKGQQEWIRSRPVLLTENPYGEDTLLYTLSIVSKQRRAEQALVESEEQLRTIYHESQDIILVIDQSEIIIRANQTIETLLGYSVQEIVGQSFTRLLGHSFSETMNDLAFDTSSTALPLISKDGTLRYMELTASIVTWQDKPAIIITLRDVSKQETMRRELEVARIARERIERERELLEERVRMVFVIEHQLRNPLSSILSSAELLSFSLSEQTIEQSRKRVERIVNNTVYIKRMMDDMLTARDAILGTLNVNPIEINLKKFSEMLFNQLAATDSQESHTFNFDYLASTEIFSLDENIITYIMENLVNNAIRYSPHGGAITLRITEDIEDILISVEDEGLGIPDDQQQAIFELFQRADNVGDIQGTGIGLALAYNAAKAHGGNLWVVSTLGKGSTFFVKLPKNPYKSDKN